MAMFKQTIAAVLVFITTLSIGVDKLSAQTTIPALFTDVAGLYVPEQQTKPAHIIRERYVGLDAKLVKALIKAVSIDSSGNSPDIQKFPKITFNLFPDANYVSGVITTIDNQVVTGTLANNSGIFQLIISEGVFAAHIFSYQEPQGEFEVSEAGNNLYKIVQINQANFAPD